MEQVKASYKYTRLMDGWRVEEVKVEKGGESE